MPIGIYIPNGIYIPSQSNIPCGNISFSMGIYNIYYIPTGICISHCHFPFLWNSDTNGAPYNVLYNEITPYTFTISIYVILTKNSTKYNSSCLWYVICTCIIYDLKHHHECCIVFHSHNMWVQRSK